jgi:hypothetical protein
VPQPIVTGTPEGMLPVNGTAAARIALTALLAERKAAKSPLACSGVTWEGLLTIAA